MTEDTAETRLAKTLFVVEATSFERYALWCRHAYNSHERPPKAECVQWEERLGEGYMPHGWLVQVGRCRWAEWASATYKCDICGIMMTQKEYEKLR
jgi:predicted RNA-binding Zn-ribbon protein involved in translation (DUF1610 family)